jgi:hypothetical protein
MIHEALLQNEFFTGGALLGALGGVFYYLKSWPLWIWYRIRRKFMYSVTIEDTNELFFRLNKWLAKNYSATYRHVEAEICRTYTEEEQSIPRRYRSRGRLEPSTVASESIGYRHHTDLFWIWRNRLPIIISKEREKMEGVHHKAEMFMGRYTLSGVWAKKRIDAFLEKVREDTYVPPGEEIKVFTNSSWDGWQRIKEISPKPMDMIVLEQKHKIIKEMGDFIGNREFYLKRGIP